MTETHAGRFRSLIVNPSISIALPFLFLLTMGTTASGTVSTVLAALTPPQPDIHLFSGWFFILLLLVQIEESIGAFLSHQERAGYFARVRELALLMVSLYLLLSLTRSGALAVRFTPDATEITRLFMLALGWILSAWTHAKLVNFEAFFRIRADHEGVALHHALRLSSSVVGESRKGLLSVGRSASVYLVLIGVSFSALWFLGLPPGSLPFATLCMFGVGFVIVRSALNIFLDEIDYGGDGLRLSMGRVKRRVLLAAAIGGAALALAILLASDRSVLPFDLLLRFFNWLLSLFRGIHSTAVPPPPQPVTVSTNELLRRYLLSRPSGPPPPWLTTLWEVLRIAGIAAAATAVIVFLFGPLVSRDFAAFLRRIHPILVLVRHAARLLRWVRTRARSFGALLTRLLRPASRSASDNGPAEIGSRRRAPVQSRRKRIETDKVRQQFARIVEWGERHEVVYNDVLTADEYAERVVKTFPSLDAELMTLTAICDEAFYSERVIGNQRFDNLKETVDSIVRTTTSD